MNVLIVGAGGREHALAWRISQSPSLTRLWVAPGNYGTGQIATNLRAGPEVDDTVEAARGVSADLVVVGPEAPLAGGLVDALTGAGIPAFGPTVAAARIESSKSFAREIVQAAHVPGPEFAVFTEEPEALEFLRRNPGPWVVKADGLAAGKGVVVCDHETQADAAVRACMSERTFGEAGAKVLMEERLEGREVSVFALTDGESISPLVAACDYKRLEDGDLGPNTGGMGSYSPPEFWTPGLAHEIEGTIMRPVVEEMARRGFPYRGVLYAGLMLTANGPKVLEFNCRFGDPETQVLMPRLASDPLPAMLACAVGRLEPGMVAWDNRAYVGVVMASGGYPNDYGTGKRITGLGERETGDGPVFAAGVSAGPDGWPETSGGRVLTVLGGGSDLAEARRQAYGRLSSIDFDGAIWRRDIASLGTRVAT